MAMCATETQKSWTRRGILKLLFFFPNLAVAKVNVPNVIGIDLGASIISAAYFDSDTPVPLARVEGGDAYRSYMQDTLSTEREMTSGDAGAFYKPESAFPEHHDAVLARAVFQGALNAITEAVNDVAGSQMRVGAITYPAHLNSSSWDALYLAAQDLNPVLVNVLRLKPSRYADVLTYPEDFCERRWGTWEGIPDREEEVILVKQGFGRIQAMLAVLAGWGPWFSSLSTAADFSEDAIKHALLDIVPDSNTSWVQAVVISVEDGELVKPISKGVMAAFPELENKIGVFSDRPEYLAAIGSACVARQFHFNPGVLDLGIPGHDEL